MSNKKIIGSGAEAVIYLDKNAIKDRVKKSYRIKEIDEKLRKSRTRREAKILSKLAMLNFPAPRLVKSDDKEILEMGFVGGDKVRDILEMSEIAPRNLPASARSKKAISEHAQKHAPHFSAGSVFDKSDYAALCGEIGRKIAVLHNNAIIHGDLTTSNMMVEESSKQIYFIDFGLSFFSHKIEDMAVDLHLLKQALESKHYTIWEKCFDAALEGYKKESKDGELVIKRLDVVEKRGRYKRRDK